MQQATSQHRLMLAFSHALFRPTSPKKRWLDPQGSPLLCPFADGTEKTIMLCKGQTWVISGQLTQYQHQPTWDTRPWTRRNCRGSSKVTKAASSLEQRAYRPQLMKMVRVNLISVTTAWRAAKKRWNQLFSAGIEDVTRGMSHRDRVEIMKSICARRVMLALGIHQIGGVL